MVLFSSPVPILVFAVDRFVALFVGRLSTPAEARARRDVPAAIMAGLLGRVFACWVNALLRGTVQRMMFVCSTFRFCPSSSCVVAAAVRRECGWCRCRVFSHRLLADCGVLLLLFYFFRCSPRTRVFVRKGRRNLSATS